ncbi:MAG: TIGR00730 family Rossman fold protein [Bacteroidota bacterium]
MGIQSVAVFCGSKDGNDPAYVTAARSLGEHLAKQKISIVYGGGSAGLMGSVADGALSKGGSVIGIIPKLLVEWEVAHRNLTDLIVCDDMHRRKQMIYGRCDLAIILPGGFGTLDELFEVLTWNQLTIHDKEILVLNTNGFYDHLLKHLQSLNEKGFLYQGAYEKLQVMNTPEEIDKWLSQRADIP